MWGCWLAVARREGVGYLPDTPHIPGDDGPEDGQVCSTEAGPWAKAGREQRAGPSRVAG